MDEKKLTGYPSIDKPWLKYYSEEAINIEVPQMSMYHHVLNNNKNRLDETAMLYQKKKITYRMFFKYVEKLAARFVAEGIVEGDIVTIISLSTPETIYAFYALNRIGATVCFEYATQSPEQLENSIKSTNPKMIIILNLFYKSFSKVLEQYGKCVVLLSPVEILSMPMRILVHKKLNIEKNTISNIVSYQKFKKGKMNEVIEVSKANLPAVLISTSGTTGIPKKVALTNGNINSIAVQYQVSGIDIRKGGKFLSIAPPFLVFGITLSIHLPLSCGMISVISTDPSPENSAKMFAEYHPNYFLGGVEHVIKISEHPEVQKMDLRDLYAFGIGGESMSLNMKEKINTFLEEHGAKGRMLTGYGMTELSGTATTETNNIFKDHSVGVPFPLVNIKIVDIDTGNEQPICQEGEILISSAGMMKEYYSKVDETKHAMVIDESGIEWVRTGDLGYVDEDGFLFIKGRIKRIYRTFCEQDGQMYKLYPDYIESELNKVPFVERAAVIVMEDKVRVNVPVAFVTLVKEDEGWKEKLTSVLAGKMPAYDMPTQYICVKEFPLKPSGKVDYFQLEKRVNNL